jgi:malate dehydrogenase (oxaloacetate-decarboxylating)(NADP+)
MKKRWPGVLIQFEDFNTELAFDLLDIWRDRYCCFNDDVPPHLTISPLTLQIQGTASVVLSGFVNAIRRSGLKPHEHRLVFLGAGSAGVGVATMLKDYLVHCGLTEEEATKTFYLVDSKGLVALNRGDKLPSHKIPLARTDENTPRLKTLAEVVDWIKPTGLLGLSTIGGSFTEDIVKKMAQFNKSPIIFRTSPPFKHSSILWTKLTVV